MQIDKTTGNSKRVQFSKNLSETAQGERTGFLDISSSNGRQAVGTQPATIYPSITQRQSPDATGMGSTAVQLAANLSWLEYCNTLEAPGGETAGVMRPVQKIT